MIVRPDVGTAAVRVELDLGTVDAVRRDLESLLTARPATLVVDLSGCGFADLRGVEMLEEVAQEAAGIGSAVVLSAPTPQVRWVLGVTGAAHRLQVRPPA